MTTYNATPRVVMSIMVVLICAFLLVRGRPPKVEVQPLPRVPFVGTELRVLAPLQTGDFSAAPAPVGTAPEVATPIPAAPTRSATRARQVRVAASPQRQIERRRAPARAVACRTCGPAPRIVASRMAAQPAAPAVPAIFQPIQRVGFAIGRELGLRQGRPR